MANSPLRSLWIGDTRVAFAGGSTLSDDLQTISVQSIDERLPIGGGEKVTLRAELADGRIFEGQATTKMPRDVGSRGCPTVHIYELNAREPLSQVT